MHCINSRNYVYIPKYLVNINYVIHIILKHIIFKIAFIILFHIIDL